MGEIDKLLKRQQAREELEFDALMQSKWRLQPHQEKIAMELLSFLAEKLPKIDMPSYRLKLYWMDKQLQREFTQRLKEKGLL
ncbi:MAG: hypothetical protein QXK47_05765 [Candidatus Bathyarchaeia archaeon]